MSELVSKEYKPKVRLQIGEGYRFVTGVVKVTSVLLLPIIL